MERCPNCNNYELDFNEFLENFVDGFTDYTFEHIWNQAKVNAKEMKKKEIAKELYSLGAAQMFVVFMNLAEMNENQNYSE